MNRASFLLRVKAFLLDYVLIFTYLCVLAVVNIFLFPQFQQLFTGSLYLAQLSGFLMVTLPVSIYFILTDSKLIGQSFGKKKVGLQVINRSGAPMSIAHSTGRTALKFLPWELSHFLVYRLVQLGDGPVPPFYSIIGGIIYSLMFTYILTAIFTKQKQSLYDILTKTQVVRKTT